MSVKDLKSILFNHMRSINASSVLETDLSELNNPVDKYYFWIVRRLTTELIPKSLISSLSRDITEGLITRNCYCYEIDVTTLTATPIGNIQTYIDRCVAETEIQNEYSQHLDNDEIDMEY